MDHPALARWQKAIENKDLVIITSLLADHVQLYSPVKHEPYVGKNSVITYLSGAFKAFINQSYRYAKCISAGNQAMLEFNLEIDGMRINGVEVISWTASGKIIEIKLMLRPTNVINRVHQMMNSRLKNQLSSVIES